MKKTIYKFGWAILALALVYAGCTGRLVRGPQEILQTPEFDPAAYRTLVERLAADDMEGRGIATEGNRKAAELIERAFSKAGLEPAGKTGSFLQCFQHPVALAVERAALEVDGQALLEQAFSPAPCSSSGVFAGDMILAGYGIHAPELGYDDYASLDPAGKVLVLFRFEPREKDPQSPFNGDRPSAYSDLRRKVFEAKSRGARAVIFTVPPRPGEDLDKQVPSVYGAEPESAAGIPVLHVLPAVVEDWLKAHGGGDLAGRVAKIDLEMQAAPVALGKATGEVRLVRERRELCNVIGRLEGEGELAGEAVVIGAHFDHLGYGQRGSMTPGVKAIHPGADDNASGVAGLLSLAKHFASHFASAADPRPRRTMIFAAFNAEEVGLAGSSAYVKEPPVPLDKTSAMLNLDMIGRLQNDNLIVLGTGSGDRWAGWLEEAGAAAGLAISSHGDGYGPSDQTPFYAAKVPVLHFFTGPHQDHHKPSDTADKLNYPGALQVLKLVARVVDRAATVGEKVAYRETSSGPPMAGDSRGWGAWLGTVPDFTAMGPEASGGVKLSGVRKGGPAERAGIQGGDRIVSMAGRKIENLYDMTFVLRDHHPGDVIDVVVSRQGREIKLAATLGSRAQMGAGKHPHGGPHGHPGAKGLKMDPQTLLYPGEEKHLKNVRQLTFGGQNAEAYWSPDGKKLIFQASPEGVPCDRIYILDLETGKTEQVSSGKGRTTCSYFTYPDGEAVFYSSTHLAGDECPKAPDHAKSRLWPVFDSYDIFLKKPGGKLKNLTDIKGYDAEGTACFKDGRIIFTSSRDGDLDLYIMDPKKPGLKPVRVTNTPGYDGGAYFSPDCSRIVWRANHPEGEKLQKYRELLKKNLVGPSRLEIWVADADGRNKRQVTKLGAVSFSPYFLPDNRRVIFSSNVKSPHSPNFDLYVIDPYAKDPEKTLEQVTFSPVFESFPMFSPDGKYLAFASNRNAKKRGETNIFIAEWVD
jgi:TolB protein